MVNLMLLILRFWKLVKLQTASNSLKKSKLKKSIQRQLSNLEIRWRITNNKLLKSLERLNTMKKLKRFWKLRRKKQSRVDFKQLLVMLTLEDLKRKILNSMMDLKLLNVVWKEANFQVGRSREWQLQEQLSENLKFFFLTKLHLL